MGIVAHRIDYTSRGIESRQASLHDLLNETQPPKTSRIIFIDSHDHYVKFPEYEASLKQKYDWPSYFFRRACHESNGYVMETTVDAGTPDERTTRHLRCLVKQIFFEDNHPRGQDIKYTWYEMTITIQRHSNGSNSIIAFGVPADFHVQFESTLRKVASERRWQSDWERINATLMQEIVRLYDESLWKMSKTIRKFEKDRSNDGQKTQRNFDFVIMHDLARHAVHTTEVLEVVVANLRELTRSRSYYTIALQAQPTVDDIRINQHDDFWCQVLSNLIHRSKSNELRLKNETDLALNLDARNFSLATIDISLSAQKDAAAMRTIAVVTLIFLPATFVATLFGMSFFNYQKGEGWSMTPEFWIFWVVTIPLTIVTVLIWFWSQKWTVKKENQNSHMRRATTMLEMGNMV